MVLDTLIYCLGLGGSPSRILRRQVHGFCTYRLETTDCGLTALGLLLPPRRASCRGARQACSIRR